MFVSCKMSFWLKQKCFRVSTTLSVTQCTCFSLEYTTSTTFEGMNFAENKSTDVCECKTNFKNLNRLYCQNVLGHLIIPVYFVIYPRTQQPRNLESEIFITLLSFKKQLTSLKLLNNHHCS